MDNGVNQLPRLLETGCGGPEETVVRDLASTTEKWIDVFRNDIRCQFTRKREEGRRPAGEYSNCDGAAFCERL